LGRTYNFSAGPASLPEAVLKQAAEEMTDYQSSGMSVMEMSHRSKIFVDIAAQAEADLRELMGVSDDYHVLFLQGGATGQFAGIPMNLTQADDTIDFIETGAWSKKAIKEAKKYCNVNVAASSAD
jgi:phosphoserine aminotransferase